MSKRTSHIMSKKQVTCSVQDDKSYVMSNMTLKIIFISQFFNVPICTFLIIWFKAGCLVLTVLQSAHIRAFQSVWQTHAFWWWALPSFQRLTNTHILCSDPLPYAIASQQIQDCLRYWLFIHPMQWMHHHLFNSFFLLNLPSSTNRTWYFRVLFKAASPYCGLVVGSLCMFH